MRQIIRFFFPLFLASCSYHVEKVPVEPLNAGNWGFAEITAQVLGPKCSRCHGQEWVGNYPATLALLAGISARIQSTDAGFMMPPPGSSPLSSEEKAALLAWIAKGGPREAGGSVPEAEPLPDGLSWAAVSARVLQPKCIRCHKTDFDTYGHTLAFVPDIEARVQAMGLPEQMPPPRASQLTAAEKALLLEWIQAGAPEEEPTGTGN